jgi:hypothetical protein
MAKQDSTKLLAGLLVLAVVVSVAGIALNLALIKTVSVPGVQVTGFSTSNQTGTVNFTQAGSAGILLTDDSVAFGGGYFNSTCTEDVSVLDSYDPEGTDGHYADPGCWINTTGTDGAYYGTYMRSPANASGLDYHVIQNNGTTIVNVTVQPDKNAVDFVCGIGGTCTPDNAQVDVKAENKEAVSCQDGSLQAAAYEKLSDETLNNSVGLCNRLEFDDAKDEIKVFYKVTIPSDIGAGMKTMTVTYMAVAI